jgi:hypothetical protein
MAPGVGKGMNIAGFDAQGKKLTEWVDDDKRNYATTPATKRQRGRTLEFNAAWERCWHYFAKTLAKREVEITKNGRTVLAMWNDAGLLYNFLLLKAWGRGELRFKLSDAGLTNEDVRKRSGLEYRGPLNKAKTVLTDMRLIKITDVSKNGHDWAVELLQPPRKGAVTGSGQSFVSAWEQPYVSKVDPAFKTLDVSEDDYGGVNE